MLTRKGKYEEAIHDILEYLVTNTDGGRIVRPLLEEKFHLKESSASDIFKKMNKNGLIKIKKLTVKKMDTIIITEKGREEYHSRFEKGEYRIPTNVKKYLDNRKITENNLFSIQKDFVNRGLIFSRKNVCVFGYPGAGKTLVAEMAMVNELTENGKVLYCTPYKALDWQKYNEFKDSFRIFPEAKISIVDGDNPTTAKDLLESKLIIATYERILGSIREKEPWLDNLSLVCGDELTLLADKERGGNIDIVLTSLKNLPQKPRLITISSLVGNALGLAKWLEAEPLIENRPAIQIPIEEQVVFREKDKLVILRKEGERKELKIDTTPLEFLIERNLNEGKTTIVFTGTKPGAERIAKQLAKLHGQNSTLREKVEYFLSKKVRYDTTQARDVCDLICHGIAYHHAGLQKNIRKFIEELLHENILKTVVATTTLGHGVDYKIDSAIIELGWLNIIRNGLPVYEYINLKGRTGRPGKSKSANVYLLASSNFERLKPENVFTKYFLSSPEPIFSSSTFSKDNIESMILSESISELDKEKTMSLMRQTFQYASDHKTKIDFDNVIDSLQKEKLLKISGNKIMATELGIRVNRSNLSPSDAAKVLSLQDTTIDSILSLATQIDIANKIQINSNLRENTVKILKNWMKGASIDEIRKLFGSFYDQELLDLVSYTSLSLKKMNILLTDKKIHDRINKIRKKLSTT